MTVAGIGRLDVPLGFAIFMTVAALVLGPLCVRGVRAVWRGPVAVFDEPFAWWVWGDALWRGYVRAIASVAAMFVVALVLTLVLIYGSGSDAVLVAVVGALLLVLGITAVLLLGITLFNRPRSLVPHYLRDQPGAIAEWREASRRRRHAGPAGSR